MVGTDSGKLTCPRGKGTLGIGGGEVGDSSPKAIAVLKFGHEWKGTDAHIIALALHIIVAPGGEVPAYISHGDATRKTKEGI